MTFASGGEVTARFTQNAGTAATLAWIATLASRLHGKTSLSPTRSRRAIRNTPTAFTRLVVRSVTKTAPARPNVDRNQPIEIAMSTSLSTFIPSRKRVRAYTRSTASTDSADGRIVRHQIMKIGTLATYRTVKSVT